MVLFFLIATTFQNQPKLKNVWWRLMTFHLSWKSIGWNFVTKTCTHSFFSLDRTVAITDSGSILKKKSLSDMQSSIFLLLLGVHFSNAGKWMLFFTCITVWIGFLWNLTLFTKTTYRSWRVHNTETKIVPNCRNMELWVSVNMQHIVKRF